MEGLFDLMMGGRDVEGNIERRFELRSLYICGAMNPVVDWRD
jgi:hypothetical protein